MDMNLKSLALSLALAGSSLLATAQSEKSTIDTIPGNVEQLQSAVAVLNRLKISGYIQAQYQKADTIGSPAAFSGGPLIGTDSRFMVRRGRIKFAYTNELSQYVLQFDVTEKGVGIKDAYAAFTDPWTKAFTLTSGAFNRPFGYEIEFSSSNRETPERSRIFQTLFVQERDLGAKLTLQAPKTSRWNFIKLDAGLFCGNGLNIETDKYKDFIGHLTANKSFLSENLNIALGASYYSGGWATGSTTYYKMGDVTTANGTAKGYVAHTAKVGDKMKREYYGLDGQMSIQTVLGLTTVRAEYLWGTQPATAKSSLSPVGRWFNDPATTYTTTVDPDTHAATTTATTVITEQNPYIREFSGGYINLVQSIGQSRHELVAKYDWYDPNTAISGNQIAVAGTKTNAADIKYHTLGFGYIYHWNTNIKITAYYENVTNETTSNLAAASAIKTYAKDQTDNIFTLRVQYKF